VHRIIVAAIVAWGVVASPVLAEDYPSKPVRLIVPYPAGGPTDIIARITADFLTPRLGQNVLVENRTGAGSQTGTDYASKATNDGYTLLVGSTDGISMLSAVKKTVPYKVPDDFTFVGWMAKSTPVIAINGKLPYKSMAELIAYAKANPGKLRYGTTGVGGGGHLSTEFIAGAAGVQLVHVPYPGSAPAITATVGGFVDMFVAGGAAVKPFSDSGQLRVLATIDKERHRLFPDSPTVGQAGLPEMEVSLLIGVLGPAGIPSSIVERLGKEIAAMAKDAKSIERIRGAGLEPVYVDSAAMKDYMVRDIDRWKSVAKSANISLE
jgi:tripartite-type tricarboxylate transporter receptor subunit TctC